MKLLLAAAALSTMIAAIPAPVAAQTDRVLTIFGEDKCPRDTICVRAPESERYRIPKEFRDRVPKASDNAWSNRVQSMEYVGQTGAGSCSASGAGGWTGCYQKMLRQAQEERKAQQQGQDIDAPR